MPNDLIQKEIEELRNKIEYYNEQFFQHARSVISDYEFDLLVKRLATLESQHPELCTPDSPTQRVGEAPSGDWQTVMHQRPMYSLSNTYEEDEVLQFVARVHKLLPGAAPTFFCESKVDGVALSVIYEQGGLQRLVTRGDGIQGDDITTNLGLIRGIPSRLPVTKSYEIRGEASMEQTVFQKLNRRYAQEHRPLLANPRNAAAGLLRTKKPEATLFQDPPLSFIPYALLGDELPVTTQEEAIEQCKAWGFSLLPTYRNCRTTEELLDYIHYWGQHKKELPVGTDGVVIKVNNLQQQHALGTTTKSPRWAVAYKYKPDSAASELLGVTYQVGRTGVITPVAELAPIQLAGSTIRRASLHNADQIQRLGLHLHDTVLLEKGGDVIPKITGVDHSKRKSDEPVRFITQCPACHTPLQRTVRNTLYYCPNHEGCPEQLKAKIRNFVNRQAMDINSLGKETIDLLFEKNLIRHPVDLYKLRAADLQGLAGFQQKSIDNLLQGIEASKSKPFEKILFALGIPHIGATVAHKLATSFPTLDELMAARKEQVTELPEIGDKIADSLIHYLSQPSHRQQLAELRALGLNMGSKIVLERPNNQPLAGKTFVVSGVFHHYSREAIHSYIQRNGGRVVGSVSKKVDFLVTGTNPGAEKLRKAQQLNIPLVTETELEQMAMAFEKPST